MIRSLLIFFFFPMLLSAQIKNSYSVNLSFDLVGYSKDIFGIPAKEGYSKSTSSDIFQSSKGINYSIFFEHETNRKFVKQVSIEFSQHNYTLKQILWSNGSSPLHFSYPLHSIGVNYYPIKIKDKKNNSLLFGLGLRRYQFFKRSLKLLKRYDTEDIYTLDLANSTLAIPAMLLKYEKRINMGDHKILSLWQNTSFDLPEGVLPAGYIEIRPNQSSNLYTRAYLRTVKLQLGMKYEI